MTNNMQVWKIVTENFCVFPLNIDNIFNFSGMIVVDRVGNIAAGMSTNGANHKIPG